MKRSVSIMFAYVFLAIGSNALLQAQTPPATEKITQGVYPVYARSPQVWRFTIDPKTMANATVAGRFSITEGVPKNIEVFVFNEENYFKWRSEDDAVKATAKPIYSSGGRKADGDLNVKVTEAGHYYVVFSNLFAYEGIKTLNADVKLQYDKR